MKQQKDKGIDKQANEKTVNIFLYIYVDKWIKRGTDVDKWTDRKTERQVKRETFLRFAVVKYPALR